MSDNAYIDELENDDTLKEQKDVVRPNDTITFRAYCFMCKEDHMMGVVVIRKVGQREVKVSSFTGKEATCPNTVRPENRNPINMNFL